MTDGALSSLKVLEYGDFISAAYCTKLMADLGADVIKIEPPVEGDRSRRQGPFPDDIPHLERSGLFLFLNTNKRGITLDPTTSNGRSIFMELVEWADIVVTNHKPSYLEQHGLDYPVLEKVNPLVNMVSITVFGYNTPNRDWQGNALVASAASGLSNYIGDEDKSPLSFPYCFLDFQAGCHGAMTALLAGRVSRLGGRGQHAWISTVEVAGTILGGAPLFQYVFQGQSRLRKGTHFDAFYPWEVVACKDGYFETITMVDAQWNAFVELLGNPSWKDDERFKDRWLATQWVEELDAYWHPWFKERHKADLTRLFHQKRISFQPINDIAEVVESDQLEAREFWVSVQHPIQGRYKTLGAPYKLSQTPWHIRRPPPLLGQHNHEVFVDLLGKQRQKTAKSQGQENFNEMTYPLQGVRVLDHGHVLAGPLLGGMFALMGAEVIKVQAPNRLSGVSMGGRGLMQNTFADDEKPTPDDPRLYHGLDRGKLSITIDLATADGKELYKRLVAVSDVVAGSEVLGVMERLGLAYDMLRLVNPRIIMASLSAAGASPGPWRDAITYGPSLSGLYGLRGILGYHDDAHPREGPPELDPTAAAHAFVGILAALDYRDRCGNGQYIDMAQGEAGLQLIAEPIMDYLFNGRIADTQGNRYPGAVPHGIYRTTGKDKWIAIAVYTDDEWSSLRNLLQGEVPEIGEARFDSMSYRLEHQDELDTLVERWTSDRSPELATDVLQRVGVAASPVMGLIELLNDPNYKALRTNVRVDAPGLSSSQIYSGIPWKLSRTPGAIRLPIPDTGQHNDYVFGEVLGLEAKELEYLRTKNVIGAL